MADVEPDVIAFELPAAVPAEQLLDGLENSVVVPRLRSSGLGTVITIALDVVGGTSGVVQLLVARHELARFGRRLLDRLRVVDRPQEGDVSLELTVKGQGRSVRVSARDPDEKFVRAALQLVRASKPAAKRE